MTNGVWFPLPSLSCIDDTVPVCDKKYCVGVREAACIAGQKAGNSWAGKQREGMRKTCSENKMSTLSSPVLLYSWRRIGLKRTWIWSLLALFYLWRMMSLKKLKAFWLLALFGLAGCFCSRRSSHISLFTLSTWKTHRWWWIWWVRGHPSLY